MPSNAEDLKSAVAGAAAWALAIVPVKLVGAATTASSPVTNKLLALALGAGISAATTPLLSAVLGWKTSNDKVRGVAIALGVAQTLDGVVHIFAPNFYSDDPAVALAGAGNVFYGAGILGILSAFY